MKRMNEFTDWKEIARKAGNQWHPDPEVNDAFDVMLGYGIVPGEYADRFDAMLESMRNVQKLMEPYAKTRPDITLGEVMEMEMKKPLRAKHRVKRAKRETRRGATA